MWNSRRKERPLGPLAVLLEVLADQPKLPGARVLPGHFQQTGISVAVPKGRPAALKIASALLEDAKKSGVVRKALDAAGYEVPVAP